LNHLIWNYSISGAVRRFDAARQGSWLRTMRIGEGKRLERRELFSRRTAVRWRTTLFWAVISGSWFLSVQRFLSSRSRAEASRDYTQKMGQTIREVAMRRKASAVSLEVRLAGARKWCPEDHPGKWGRLRREVMLALTRQEQSEKLPTDLLYLSSHSESYSSCRGERLFARRGGSHLTGAKQEAERSQSANAGQSPSVASQAAPGQFRLRRAKRTAWIRNAGRRKETSLVLRPRPWTRPSKDPKQKWCCFAGSLSGQQSKVHRPPIRELQDARRRRSSAVARPASRGKSHV